MNYILTITLYFDGHVNAVARRAMKSTSAIACHGYDDGDDGTLFNLEQLEL